MGKTGAIWQICGKILFIDPENGFNSPKNAIKGEHQIRGAWWCWSHPRPGGEGNWSHHNPSSAGSKSCEKHSTGAAHLFHGFCFNNISRFVGVIKYPKIGPCQARLGWGGEWGGKTAARLILPLKVLKGELWNSETMKNAIFIFHEWPQFLFQ